MSASDSDAADAADDTRPVGASCCTVDSPVGAYRRHRELMGALH